MTGVIDNAASLLAQSVRRAEVASHNIANLTTPGYRARVSFAALIEGGSVPHVGVSVDPAAGELSVTGDPLDLAVLGEGQFLLRDATGFRLTRAGRFERAADGRLIGEGGGVLQSAEGGDLRLTVAAPEIASDGVVLEDGAPTGRVAVVRLDDDQVVGGPPSFSAVERPTLRQGAFETSNVSLSAEMIVLMDAVRRAETAQRLVNVYDDLLGRAISGFSQGQG